MRCLVWLALVISPAMAGLLPNGDFAEGQTGWGTWSPTPERLQLAIVDGAARLTLAPGAPATGCVATAATGLDMGHDFTAGVSIDAKTLTAGYAVLRIEFWRIGSSEPTGRAESIHVIAGQSADVSVDFRPPGDTGQVKIVGYLVDAVGGATFDDFTLLDRTGPVVRPTGPALYTAGEDASASLSVINGTAQAVAGQLSLTVRDGQREVASKTIDLNLPTGEERQVQVALGQLPAGSYTMQWSAAGIADQRSIQVLDPPHAPLDRYGGWADLDGEATGFFHTQQIDQRWWLVDPAGHRFFSTGCNGVNEQGTGSPALGYSPYRRANVALYGGDDNLWAATAISRLRLWGFNTLGSWSSELAESAGMPYTHILNIGRLATSQQMTRPGPGRSPWSWFPDVFAEDFVAGAKRVAASECAPRKDDPLLVGYFLDNEFSWDGLWEAVFTTEPNSACRNAFVQCAKGLFATVADLRAVAPTVQSFDDLRKLQEPLPGNKEWRDAWLETVSEQYYSVTTAAIRAVDPNHLIISQRYAGHTPDPSARAAGRHCDVVCMNFYNDGVAYGISTNLQTRFAELAELTGKPMLIGEWSFKAMDSSLPNVRGAATPVETQQDRAIGYASFLATAAANPYLVGAHWFIHSDQPLEGRGDGENSNYGLVDQTDRPYPELVTATSFMNRFAYRLASAAKFGQMAVDVQAAGSSWVTAGGNGFGLNQDGGARFSAKDDQLGELQIGLPSGGAARATWREGADTVTVTAPANHPRSYLYRRGDTVIDGAQEPNLPAPVDRPFVTMEPSSFPHKAARYPVTLTIHNPTSQPVKGEWQTHLSPGWLIDDLPAIDVAPGGTAQVKSVLTAPAGSMSWPRLEVWQPFIDLVVWRSGDPVDLVALPSGDLVVQRHGREAAKARLTLASEPAGLTGAFDLTWQAGQTTQRVKMTGKLPANTRSARLVAAYTPAGGDPLQLATQLYDLNGDLTQRPDVELPEGAKWLADPGVIHLQRQTIGTIDCAFPSLPLEPGHATVVVSARARWQGVAVGPGESWHRANLAVYFTDDEGQYVSHADLMLGDGDSDWQSYMKVLRVPAGATQMAVHARMLECTGELWVDDVAVLDCPAELSREMAGPVQ